MRIAFCGDIALWRRPEDMILRQGESLVSAELKGLLRDADVFVANIECPLTDRQDPLWDYFRTLKASKCAGQFLKELGVHVGSLANNHIADYGSQGMADTISVLEELDISWVGAGWSAQKARSPLIITKGDLRIGILALAQPEISAATRLGWGAGVLEDAYALNRMALLTKEVDIAIAYLHFGVEFSEYPTPHQIRLARGLVDAGAKLVIGHHPHVPQGYEFYKDGFIAYSLGNFIFDMSDGPHRFSRLGLVIQADFSGKDLTQVKVLPVDTRNGKTRAMAAEEIVNAEEYLSELCTVLHDQQKLNEKYYLTCRNNFELYIRAFIYNAFLRRNWRQARDVIFQNVWPQLFELRRDLARFLLSGEALEIERSHRKSRDGSGHLWQWVCTVSHYIGIPTKTIPGFRVS